MSLSSRSMRLPCCGNFVHKRSQQRWEMEGQNANCGMCRRLLNTTVARGQQQTVQVTLPTEMIDHQAISNEVMTMSRDQIIARLRALLDSPALEEQLMMVRIYYFLFHATLCKKNNPLFHLFQTNWYDLQLLLRVNYVVKKMNLQQQMDTRDFLQSLPLEEFMQMVVPRELKFASYNSRLLLQRIILAAFKKDFLFFHSSCTTKEFSVCLDFTRC